MIAPRELSVVIGSGSVSCPHSTYGTPMGCSQCVGAQARIVTLDRRGHLLVGGVPSGRGFIPGTASRHSRAAGRSMQMKAKIRKARANAHRDDDDNEEGS